MKVSELEAGATCDALVALAQGWELVEDFMDSGCDDWIANDSVWAGYSKEKYQPSTNGGQWAEIVANSSRLAIFTSQNNVDALYCDDKGDHHFITVHYEISDDIGLAVCKAFLASKWGDTIPDEIMERFR